MQWSAAAAHDGGDESAELHVPNENGKLMRVADFVTFFKGLKASPDDVIVAAITRAADAVQRDAPARARADDRHGRDGAAHRSVVHVQQR